MADKEVTKRTATRMVEVWASTADALLQEWLKQGIDGDRLGMMLTSYKLSQLGLMLKNYFGEVGQAMLDGDTEVKAARQAVEQLDSMVRRAMVSAGVGSPGQASVERDPSLN